MPLFELYNSMMEEEARRAAQAKSMAISPEPFSTSDTICIRDFFGFRRPEDEFGELIWSNGPRKKLLQPTEPDRASPYAGGRVQEIEDGTGVMTKSAEVVPLMAADELKRSVQVGLSAQAGEARDDMDVPWITCDPMEESFPREIPQDDYCAEFLKEFSAGFALNSSTFRPSAERSGDSEHGRAPKAGAAVLGACGRPLEFSHQHGLLNTSLIVPEHYKPRRNAGTGRRPQQLQQRERRVGPISPRGAPSSPGAPSGGGGLINFSHFMRPFALGKACPEGDRAAGGKLPSGQESTSGSKPLESTLVESGSGFKCTRETPPPVMAEAKPAAKPPHQEAAVVNVDRSDAFCREDYLNTKNNDKAKGANYAPDLDMPSSSSFAASFALSRHEKRRISEAAEASSSSSSSSSGNSHGQASTGHYKRRGKRKHREEVEESDRSDPKEHARDRGTKKHVYQRSAGTKRGRAAEVHNISERRRRDRINDRMRALQELIPNCNKVVDKASMLQEAIEYTKSLQFQLQMMSMGSGALCMPQTVARGMQQFRLPTVTPFPAMGMGLGFGMGVHDMISGCSGPMFPIPPLLPQQFGCANSLAGTQAGLPALMPRLPLDALLALSTKASMVSGTPRTGAPSTQHADPTTTAVTSDDKRGKDLHAEAVEKPN